jgi:prepilin-type N-terminal cleavage/methylation domain-containing protein
MKNKGFTLAELVISISILSLIAYVVGSFQYDLFSLNFSAQNSMISQFDARHISKYFAKELREASISSLGAYPIALASSTAITFYSDVNNDGLKERVRYYTSGNKLMRGELSPSGSPLVYNSGNEKITTAISNITNSSTTPIFEYYSAYYAGTSSPLSQPVNINEIRMVKMYVIIDKDSNKSPTSFKVETKVNVRNLKDNF